MHYLKKIKTVFRIFVGIYYYISCYAHYLCCRRFHLDYLIHATLLYIEFRTSFKRISRNQLLNNVWVHLLRILCFRTLLVWGESWHWFKFCSCGHIVWELFRFLSLRNVWLDQLYFLQRIPTIHNSFGYRLGISIRWRSILVRLLNFFTLFLPKLVSSIVGTFKALFEIQRLTIIYFFEKIFYWFKFFTCLYPFKN